MTDIYLLLNGQQMGPYQPAQLHQMLAAGQVTSETPAWHQALSEWSTVSKVLAAFPIAGAVPGMPPPPPAPSVSPRKKMSGVVIAAIVAAALFVGLFVLSCLAGIALGPIKLGIVKAKENLSMQQARGIGLLMFAYASDHNGAYPDGASSTEVFQKLIDEKYVSDASIFYFPMEGKTKPTSNHLTADNVCYDVTSGITSDSSDSLPIAFSTGYVAVYNTGASANPDPNIQPAYPGIAVAYKNNSARFVKALPDGTIPQFVSSDFTPGTHNYRQLKP